METAITGEAKSPKESPATKPPKRRRPATVKFVEGQRGPAIDTGSSPAVYEVLLPHGRAVRVGHDFDPDVLKRLIATVEASC